MDYFVEIAVLRQAQYRLTTTFRNDIKKLSQNLRQLYILNKMSN